MGVVHLPGEGESLFGGRIVLKAAYEELCITESWFDSARDGAGPHIHKQHVDSFYVLEGEVEFQFGDERQLLGAGSFVAAAPGEMHTFGAGPDRSRLLNIHAPSGGFHLRLRENS